MISSQSEQKQGLYLQSIIAWRLDELFLELLLVVVFARRRLLLLVVHDLVSKGGTGAPEELACATSDIVPPIRMLHVLRT